MAKTKPKRHRLRRLRLDEVSLVDQGANPGAHVALIKRKEQSGMKLTPTEAQRLAKAAMTFAEALAEEMARRVRQEMADAVFGKIWTLERTLRSIIDDPDIDDITVAIQAALDDFVAAAKEELPDTDPADAVEKSLQKTLHPEGRGPSIPGDPTMDPEEIKALQDQLAEAQTAVALFKALSELTDAEKAHYSRLDEAEQATFLAAAPDARVEQITKAAQADEELVVNGLTIRKSKVGAEQFEALKTIHNDAQADRKKARETEATRAAEQAWPALPGEPIAKARAHMALTDLPAAVQETITAMLKSGNEALRLLEREAGHGADLTGSTTLRDHLEKKYAPAS